MSISVANKKYTGNSSWDDVCGIFVSDKIYVCDSYRKKICIYNLNGNYIRSFKIKDPRRYSPTMYLINERLQPKKIFVRDNIYIFDKYTSRIFVFDLNYEYLESFILLGYAKLGFIKNSNPFRPFLDFSSIFISDKKIYACENLYNTIMIFDMEGFFLFHIEGLKNPHDVFVSDKIYICDEDIIKIYDLDGNFLKSLDISASSIFVTDKIYISNNYGRIIIYTLDGDLLYERPGFTKLLFEPKSLFVLDGKVYAYKNGCIKIYTDFDLPLPPK